MDKIITLRLASHGLIGWWFSSVESAVRHMGCIQSQDIGQATRCVGSRIPWSTKQDVRQALTDGKIIRTRPMRGTLHYMAPENVHRMLDLCASKTLTGFAKRREFLWISDKHAEQALDIIDSALRGGKSLTRTQLGQSLQDWWIPMQAQRIYHLTCYAATRKLICFGPPMDKEETFVLLDERVDKPLKLNYDEQLAALATMYIRGHGPVTVDDLARWCGLGKTVCKQAIASIASECETIEYHGKTYYYLKTVTSNTVRSIGDNEQNNTYTSRRSPQQVRGKHSSKWQVLLLWWFDEYFLGYKDRSIVADTAHYEKMFTKNGIFFPLIIVDGRVVWVWKRSWKKDSCIFDIQLLPNTSSRAQSRDLKTQLEIAAQDYATFWGVQNILFA